MNLTRRNTLIILIVIAFVGMVYLWLLLPDNVGVGADTVIYYAAAQNLRDGQGLTMPFGSTFAGTMGELMTHFPPFYPILLAILGLGFGTIATGATWTSILFFGGIVFVVGWIMLSFCPDQPWLALVAAFLTLTSGAMIRLHTVALSEPVFILCWLIGYFLLDRYLQSSRTKLLLFSALLLAVSFLTRFSGLAFITTAFLWLLYKRGWKTAVLFGVVAPLPMATWMVYGSVVGSATNRAISVHWISSHHLWQGVYAIAAWLSPDILPISVKIFIWLGLLVCFAWLVLNRQLTQTKSRKPLSEFFKLLLVTLVIYMVQIILSISFLDVQVRLSPRILSPIYLSLMMTLLYLISNWWPQAEKSGRRVVTAVLGIVCLAYLGSAIYIFLDIQQNGEHYTGAAWRDSEILAYLQTVDNEISYVSNGPDLIYFYTNLSVTDIPAQFKNTSLLPNKAYQNEMDILETEMEAGAQLVYFNNMQWRWFLPNEADVVRTLSLRKVKSFADGTIYVWDGK